MSMLSIIVLGGSVITAVLAAIAGYLMFKVYRQRKEREVKLDALEKENQQALREQKAHTNKSIQILAQALHNQELTLTEASIRISGLLDILGVTDEIKAEFSAFYQLREKTSHIPYLKAWQNLSNAEQRKFDRERLQQETTFNDFVMDAAKRILGRDF